MLDDITELRTFAKIVAAGSLSAAGREMGISLSVVSKRLATLERRTDTSLIVRSTRHLALTEEGQRLFDRAQRILADRDAMRGVLTRPAGRRAVSWISVSALAFLWVVLLAGGILTGCGLHQLLIALPLAAALYLASFLLAARSLPLALAPAIILYFWSIMACGNDITLNNPIIWRTGVMGWTLVPQDYPDRFWEMFIASVAASIAMKSIGDRWVRKCVVHNS